MVTNRQTEGFRLVVSALVLMGRAREGIVSSERLAEQLGTHPVVVRRLLGPLRLTGLIEARSGPGGGWAIARDPAEVRLGALYRRVAGEVNASRRTRLDRVLADARAAYVDQLDRWTLADVIDGA